MPLLPLRPRLALGCIALAFMALAAFVYPQLAAAQKQSADSDPRAGELYEEARAAEANGDPATAVAKYKSLIEAFPSLGPAYNNLGALYLRQRDYDDAVAILEKGLKVNPKMSSAVVLLGISLYQEGDYARAKPHLEAALRANPKDGNVEMFLAKAELQLGDRDSAVAHLQTIVRRDPKNQDAWYQLGRAYMQLSEEALTRLREIDPDSVLVHEVSGEIMESMNNYDGAILEYKKAVEMAPHDAGTHYKLGNAYWSISQWDAATQEFQAELANDPRNCLAMEKIGNVILEQHGDADQALDLANKSLAICPNDLDARADRARALLRLNRPADSVPDLQAVAKATPEDPTVHFLLGQAYRSLGRTQEAESELQLYSKLEAAARANTASRAQQVMQQSQSAQPQSQQPSQPQPQQR
jgi:tetratricopeptide (TPR) repeat protein